MISMQLDYTTKQMFLAGLQVARSENIYPHLAQSIGASSSTRARLNACNSLSTKISKANVFSSVNLTKSNIKQLVSALQDLDYMYSIDSKVALMITGVKSQFIDSEIEKLRVAYHGKQALNSYYKSKQLI